MSPEEQRALKAGLRSRDSFTARRAQILLASSRGHLAPRIGEVVGCCEQTVRDAIHAFHHRGLAALQAGSPRPKSVKPVLSGERQERLAELLRHSPREYGKQRSVWTLPLLAEVSFQEGLTPERMSGESVRRAVKRLKLNWKRAKRWLHSPDPAYGVKKSSATG